jgi:hypothetical protein
VLTVLDASGNCAAVCASQKIAVNNDDRQFFTDISPIELSEYISDETFENIVYHNKGLLYLRNAWLNVSANIDFNFADLSAAEKTGFK